MAKTKIPQVPLGNYPDGIYTFGPIATPNGLDGFDIRVGRCTTATPTLWPNVSTTVKIDMQYSYDGGVTYTPLGANSFGPVPGGIISSHGVETAEWVTSAHFSPNEPTHFKGQITVAGGPIRTYLDATVDQ